MDKKTIRIYILISSITQFFIGLQASIYVTYLLSNGLNFFQVNLVNFFFMIAVFLLEIPTGTIADIFGRKFSFVLSNIITSFGFIIYGMTDNFTGFIIAEIVIALGVTLTSGAFKAWLVDSLNYYKWNGNLLSVFRLNGRMTKSAQLMGGLIGAYLGATNLSIPFIVTGVGFLIVAIIAHLIMKEEYFDYHSDKKPRAWLNIKKIALDSINYGLKHHVVFLVITVSMVLEFGFMALNMYWQPWFRPSLPGNEYLGYIWAGIVIFSMIGNEIVNWFEKKIPNIKIGYLVIGFSAGLMIIASAIPIFMLSLTAFYLHEIARGLFEPYTDAKLQENIPAKNRATINSFVSMTRKGAAGLGLIVFGLITNSYGISLGWILSGLTIIILLPMAMLINGRHKKAF